MTNDHIVLQSPVLIHHNINILAAIFTNCVTLIGAGKDVAFDFLHQKLNCQNALKLPVIIPPSDDKYILFINHSITAKS